MKPKLFLTLLTVALLNSNLTIVWAEAQKTPAAAPELVLSDDLNTAQAMVDKDLSDLRARFNLAAAYTRSPQIEKSWEHIQVLEEKLKASGEGQLLIKIDEFISELEAAKYSENSSAQYRLALLYYLKSRKAPKGRKKLKRKSIEKLDLVLKQKPQDIWSLNYKGFINYELNKNITEATKIWQEARKVDKDHPLSYFLEGQAQMKLGQAPEGLALISQAMILRAKAQAPKTPIAEPVNTQFIKN